MWKSFCSVILLLLFVVCDAVAREQSEMDRWYLATFSVAGSPKTTGRTVTLQMPGALYVVSADLSSDRRTSFACAYRPWKSGMRERIYRPKPGVWQVDGPHVFSIPQVREVWPRYLRRDGFLLGSGESVVAGRYCYASCYEETSPSFADRAFQSVTNGCFHQPFWRLKGDGALVYHHDVGGRVLSNVTVCVTTRYGPKAAWGVEISGDGCVWRSIVERRETATVKIDVPRDFHPSKELFVRIVGRGTGDFRVESYQLSAKVGSDESRVFGQTDWVDVATGDVISMPGAPVLARVTGARVPGDGLFGLRLWTCDSGWKVMPDSPVPTESRKEVRVRLAANETEAVQLVLRSSKNRPAPKVSMGDLVSCEGIKLPAECIEILRVGYVKVEERSDKTCPQGLFWPDPLFAMDVEAAPIVANENRVLWIRVKAPKGTAKGIYRGAISIGKARVPFAVEVFGFELPDTLTCQTAFGLRYHQIVGMQRLREGSLKKVLPKYVKCLADHHITPYDSDPTVRLVCEWKNGEPTFNWSEWDEKIRKDLEERHFNSIRIPTLGTLGGGDNKHAQVGEICGVKDGEPGYEEMTGKFWRAVDRHLAEKGWTDKAYVYWFDEPDKTSYLFVSNGFARLRNYAPHLKRMLTKQPEPSLVNGVNLWCPLTSAFHDNPDLNRSARVHGDDFWWYVCCVPKGPYVTAFIDKPGVEMRVWLWQSWKEKVRGVLVWDTIYWTSGTVYNGRKGLRQNPYLDTQSWADNGAYGWGNGDGRLMYPPRACFGADGRWSQYGPEVLEGPVESYRLEMLRDGLEDYEYFAILRRLNPDNPLLAVPTDVTSSMTDFSKDPAPIMRHRLRLAREIEARQGTKVR